MGLTRASLFKVTNADGTPCYGGRGAWSLPTLAPDGTWTPGKAREVTGPLKACANGLHLARGDQLIEWLGPAIWVAEYDPAAPALDHGDKVVVARARLVRGTPWDDRIARHFACDCAERALALVATPDERSVAAVRIARAFADGRATEKELAAAWAAAGAAVWYAAGAAWAATGAAERYAVWAAAGDAERAWQADRLLHYLNGGQP